MLFYGKTDVGKRRQANQDNFIVKKYSDDVVCAVVCDGMGGANGGGVASSVAAEAFIGKIDKVEREHSAFFGMTDSDILGMLSEAVYDANREVYRLSREDLSLYGMGTTLVACIISAEKVYIVNVGDSRLYSVEKGEITQVSHDHSMVQYLIDMGELTPEEAKSYKKRNVIIRAVGTEKTVEADKFTREMPFGSYIILCSDGLTNHVEPDEISDTVSKAVSAEEMETACENLIALANERGGLDNITAVVMSI